MTTLFGNTAVLATVAASKAPRKTFWLPVLVVLFLLSYGMMALLIIEQGATIESQRLLIQELFRDSTELSAAKKAIASNSAHSAPTQADPVQAPSKQVPLERKTPSSQAPAVQAQTPSTQVPAPHAPQHHAKNKAVPTEKPLMELPSRPASDLDDERRAVKTI